MNVRREELRVQQPDATTIEVTKLIGAEWMVLADDIKQPYLAAAKIDFDRYNQECSDYKKAVSGVEVLFNVRQYSTIQSICRSFSFPPKLRPTPMAKRWHRHRRRNRNPTRPKSRNNRRQSSPATNPPPHIQPSTTLSSTLRLNQRRQPQFRQRPPTRPP